MKDAQCFRNKDGIMILEYICSNQNLTIVLFVCIAVYYVRTTIVYSVDLYMHTDLYIDENQDINTICTSLCLL